MSEAVMIDPPVPMPASLELPEPEAGSLSATYPSLEGQVAVVIGGTTLVGAAIVRQLAWQGARVAVLDDDADACDRMAQLNEAMVKDAEPDAILTYYCNVHDPRRVAMAIDISRPLLGDIGLLVSIAPTSRALLAQAAIVQHDMQRLGKGRILCVSPPSLTIHRLAGFKNLARAVAPARIAVNQLIMGCLGGDQVWPDPYGPADVARLAAYLLSDDCPFTGQAWTASGRVD